MALAGTTIVRGSISQMYTKDQSHRLDLYPVPRLLSLGHLFQGFLKRVGIAASVPFKGIAPAAGARRPQRDLAGPKGIQARYQPAGFHGSVGEALKKEM